jgi:hypothetical protein
VNPRIELTFARSLRSILRQDPDIIMIGEIRDLETAQIAVQASLTGHLVLATLHTNDAVSAVTRLADMGVEPTCSRRRCAGPGAAAGALPVRGVQGGDGAVGGRVRDPFEPRSRAHPAACIARSVARRAANRVIAVAPGSTSSC